MNEVDGYLLFKPKDENCINELRRNLKELGIEFLVLSEGDIPSESFGRKRTKYKREIHYRLIKR